MPTTPDDPLSHSASSDGDCALSDLRRQLDAVKQRVEEHRSQLRAAGLTRDDPEAPVD